MFVWPLTQPWGFALPVWLLCVCMWVTLVIYRGVPVTEVCETWVMTGIQRNTALCASVYMWGYGGLSSMIKLHCLAGLSAA